MGEYYENEHAKRQFVIERKLSSAPDLRVTDGTVPKNMIGDFIGFVYNRTKRRIPQHLNHFTKNGLIKLISYSGFILVQIRLEPCDFLTMKLRNIVQQIGLICWL